MQHHKSINRHENVDIRYDGKLVKRTRSKLDIQLATHNKRMVWLGKWCSEYGLFDTNLLAHPFHWMNHANSFDGRRLTLTKVSRGLLLLRGSFQTNPSQRSWR